MEDRRERRPRHAMTFGARRLAAARLLALGALAAGLIGPGPIGAGPAGAGLGAAQAAQGGGPEVASAPLGPPTGTASAYLRARHLALSSDYEGAARHYMAALSRDPDRRVLMEGAVAAFLAAGRMDGAAAVAGAMIEAGHARQIAVMALQVSRGIEGDWGAVLAAQAAGQSMGPLADALAHGWARVGLGDGAGAIAAFDALAEKPGLEAFGRLHGAYARAALGDWVGAEGVFAGGEGRPALTLGRRGALVRLAVLSRIGRGAEAAALLDAQFGPAPDPAMAVLRARLLAGEPIPIPGRLGAREGLGEAFFTLATALEGEAAQGYTLLYARAAEALAPEHGDATLLAGSLLSGLGRHAEALRSYEGVAPGHVAHPAAQLGRAEALGALGRPEEALAVLHALVERHPAMPRAHAALGDALRARGRHAEAQAAYDRAFAAHADPSGAPWSLHFARALAREGAGDWAGARGDLDRALALAPEEPRVLAHLGRAMIARGEPLAEALPYIERARAAAPESGPILGSLGWALYRMGRAEEAVGHLERAAALIPLDPLVNDRLGDALWAVGREREARFQWSRAMGLDPEAGARLRLKLAHGIVRLPHPEGASVRLVAKR